MRENNFSFLVASPLTTQVQTTPLQADYPSIWILKIQFPYAQILTNEEHRQIFYSQSRFLDKIKRIQGELRDSYIVYTVCNSLTCLTIWRQIVGRGVEAWLNTSHPHICDKIWDFFTFSITVLNNISSGPKSIFLTRKFTVIKVLEVEKWKKLNLKNTNAPNLRFVILHFK